VLILNHKEILVDTNIGPVLILDNLVVDAKNIPHLEGEKIG
jgi:hypothetical protein